MKLFSNLGSFFKNFKKIALIIGLITVVAEAAEKYYNDNIQPLEDKK